MEFEHIQTAGFDYGNTLIELGAYQTERLDDALESGLTERYGSCDRELLSSIRRSHRLAPYSNGFLENDLRHICRDLLRGLYDLEPGDGDVDWLIETRSEAFVELIVLPDGVREVLARLSERYRLSLVSNYPCGRTIRSSLDKLGLTGSFESIVVSGDIGYVKPHPEPFQAMLDEMAIEPAACVFIGDNWLADIQGAKRLGMSAIHFTGYEPHELAAPRPGDIEPDARIGHLRELEALLLD